MRGVRFVDYSRPGFAVVYAHEMPPPSETLRLSIRATDRGLTRLEPREAAVGSAGSIVIVNETSQLHGVSDPSGGTIHRIEPGKSVRIRKPRAGLHSLYLLDDLSITVRVFVAPGPYAVVSSRGRYELAGLPPGAAEIRAWHPRFPSTAAKVQIPIGESVRVDLELGVAINGSGSAQ